ncbi:ralBP1-associated Eps domain-containing protein 2 isoform X6 [Orcinus orca]|uniref:RalBP1-associated Eps domain-containing protein 2 isoform X6 n=1 Tax=Tursiops truncatus TaxID=9739 RepID=A0A2U4AJP9_TURTR|nr:ralBP1-associated Eps domain-containing protein 2 isoform X6 [Tursiops truncatus]XP_030704019.1 ralBP1-associated Eps domain-containing protein 2 isoform X6 [Globicephala melas]XP_033283783.1 ralBP1-associated Eps domain-containing protein 2 isoform X6 [Orcinus orca]XP_059993523.1 ralBP1-associated Eps domain-containing protein 2 isoform X4 [Lagenorhynchus albirostris]
MEAAASGGCGSGPPLLLSEGEQQCYSELFARCAGAAGGGPGSGPPEAARAAPGAATAASGPVADLFRASQLPAETLHQITELCGAKRVGYFGPTQFYVALKLIAAAQSGLPVRIESIKCAPYEARQPLVQPEGPSLGGPGAKPLRHQASLIRSFSVERELQDNNSSYPDEPWRITEEQREYYVNQFRSLQPDPSSFISGSVAKNFFTKSKLSIPELSYIWELSDADCDGALSLPEFCAAFHLIVARKNGYPLPEGLPPTLQPEYLQAAFPKPKWECALFDSYSESVPANQQPRDLNRMEKLSIKDMADFPVPTQDVTGDDKQALKSATDEALPKDMSEDSATPKDSNSLKARPRSRSYSSTSIEEAMKRGEDPPTPPPRPQKTHSRASSLDLNKVFQPSVPASKSGLLPPPPALPPRPCPSQSEQASEAELHPQLNRAPSQAAESSPAKKDIPYSQPPSKPIRRKFRPENQATESQEPTTAVGGPASVATVKPHPTVQKQSSKQKKAIQTAIRKNKEANAVLARLNSELQQQLKEVHQERIALENQLEQLRPVTVL